MSLLEKRDVHSVLIELSVGERKSLLVLLASDGTINRMGRGTIDNEDQELFQGRTQDRLFESLMLDVDDRFFQFAGRYRDHELVGEECRLNIVFQGEDDSTGFEFVYGTESQGPPTEICDLVVSSVDLTDPWYENQLAEAQ